VISHFDELAEACAALLGFPSPSGETPRTPRGGVRHRG